MFSNSRRLSQQAFTIFWYDAFILWGRYTFFVNVFSCNRFEKVFLTSQELWKFTSVVLGLNLSLTKFPILEISVNVGVNSRCLHMLAAAHFLDSNWPLMLFPVYSSMPSMRFCNVCCEPLIVGQRFGGLAWTSFTTVLRYLRWDGYVNSEIIIALISIWDEMVRLV